ncbi:MAG TPA: GGDEF domain-containing protein [Nitrosomonas mobilis]|nr:GGDEF domain-containing protein [Nitrosomonas mobilis]
MSIIRPSTSIREPESAFPRIVCLVVSQFSLPSDYTDWEIDYYLRFEDWIPDKSGHVIFVIANKDPSAVVPLLQQIRRHPDFCTALCYVTGSVNPEIEQLADGGLPEAAILRERFGHFQELLTSFNESETAILPTGRLIKYLWLRPHFVVKPCRTWQTSRYWFYPLLNALNPDDDAFDWLRALVNQRVIESADLIDRQRECPHCRSSHLSFIDVCPNCGSLDIAQQASLHCFTCGHVDVQDNFLQGGALVCPKCLTQLRHIGSDFDRPIENHSCHTCHHVFVESDVQVRCMHCGRSSQPTDLVEHKIQSLRLSDRGRIIAVRGDTFDIAASFDQLQFIPGELFKHDLDWLLILARRYSMINFSLFGIYFPQLPELAEKIGHVRLMQLLEVFAQRLRSMLRTPDLSTRTAENMLWLLLPQTDEKGLRGFHTRIKASLGDIMKDSDHQLDYQLIGINSAQINEQEDAQLLMARLYAEVK